MICRKEFLPQDGTIEAALINFSKQQMKLVFTTKYDYLKKFFFMYSNDFENSSWEQFFYLSQKFSVDCPHDDGKKTKS